MSNLCSKLAELSSEEKEHFLGEVPRLFLEGHRIKRLCRLLSDYDFIEAKINHPKFGVKALIEDYDLIDDEKLLYRAKLLNRPEYDYQTIYQTLKSLKLIQGALRLSAHILTQDTKQLAGQLTGRLLYFDTPDIQKLLQQIPQTQTTCLRSLRASLSIPNGLLLSTLTGHIGLVNAVTVTPDGKFIISGSSDTTVKVWNLNTGAEVITFTGHNSSVNAVAVTPDGKRVISGEADSTVRAWNLATGQEIQKFNGHSASVVSIAVTTDGKKVVSASNSIKVWDLETGKEELTLKTHRNSVTAVAITSFNRIISASHDGTIHVSSLESGKILFGFRHYANRPGNSYIDGYVGSEPVYAIAATPDGQWLISGSGNSAQNQHTIMVWDLQRQQKAFTLKGHNNPISTLAITPDGGRVISASFNDNTIKVWAIAYQKEIFTLSSHDASIYALAVTLDGQKIISASKDKTLKVWNLDPQNKDIEFIDDKKSVNSVSITPDGRQAILGLQDNTIKVWNLEKFYIVDSFAIDSKSQYNIYFKIQQIFEKYYIRLIDRFIIQTLPIIIAIIIAFIMMLAYVYGVKILFNLFNNWAFLIIILIINLLPFILQSITKLYFHYNKYPQIKTKLSQKKISHNSKSKGIIAVDIVAIASNNWLICINHQIMSSYNFLSVWNYKGVNKPKYLLSISQQCYIYLNLLICSIYILMIISSWGKILFIILYVIHKILYSLIYLIFHDSPTTISITRNGKYLISGSTDKTIKIWDLQNKKQLFSLNDHQEKVTTLTIIPDGKYLISGSDDKTIKVWNLETRERRFTLIGHEDSVNTISVTPDGKYLISGSKDKTIKIWNLETREDIFTFTGHTDSINAINLTSNGQLVISASSDKTIQVWNFATRKLIAKFTGESPIKCCAVAPDDVTIVAGEESGRIHFLRLEGIEVQS